MQKLFFALAFFCMTCTAVRSETLSMQCHYDLASFLVFEDGAFKADTDSKEMSFTITIDTTTNKAYLTGNSGTADLAIINREGQMSFLQVSGNGPAIITTLTTVFLNPAPNKKFPSLHARQNRFGANYTTAQYTGYCSTF